MTKKRLMIDSIKVGLAYTFFAFIATIVNILSQDTFLRLYSKTYSITISIFVGTLTGLVIKYYLDKKYIFKYKTTHSTQNKKLFILYSLMGLITTTIFWGFELGFNYIFQNKEMRYFGGVIGLIIGYILKYQLDKKFVFRQE